MNTDLQSQVLQESYGILRLRALRMGDDWCLSLTGGDREHLGAVAMAQPRPSLAGDGLSATASVLALAGHKEDMLARSMALFLAARLNACVSVSCGIHVENASQEQIQTIENHARRLMQRICERMVSA